jgi:capsular polysaccharide biosynthesis protein
MGMEQELDLMQYWQVLKKRWRLIVVLPLIAALVSGIVSFFIIKPVYQASTTLIVGKKAYDDGTQQAMQLLDYNVLMANQQLAKTYGTIAKSRTVEENVIQKLALPLTTEQLDNKIAVNPVKNTEVLEIAVLDQDPEMAAHIANAMAEEFSATIIQIKKVDSVSIIDKAVAPSDSVKPKKALNTLIAFVVGLMFAIGLALLLEFLDNTIKDEKDVEEILGLPVLGLIPHYDGDNL